MGRPVEKMRIGHIIYRYKPLVGGAEIYLDRLFKILHRAGYLQRVYQRDDGFRSPEIVAVPKLTNRLPKLVAFNLALPFRYRDLAREDLLIVDYPEHYLPIAWHRNVAVLSHGATWTQIDHPANRFRKKLAQFAFDHARQYICNDTFVLRQMGLNIEPASMFFQEVEKGRWFIPNCVDTFTFRKNEGLAELKNLNPILVPRNLTPPRGADLAIRAFSRFVKEYPETNLVIVGDAISDMASSINYKNGLKLLVKDLSLVHKVHFFGSADIELMPNIYSSSLLTLIPTRCSEGTSFSALESMACGTATISTDVEGLLDLPTIHCEATADDLSRKMKEVFENREQIGLEQQERTKETYNHKNWEKAWLKVIEKAAQRQ